MIEDSLFRIISLAILMIVTGIGWYKIKLEKLKNEKEDHKKIKKRQKMKGLSFQ